MSTLGPGPRPLALPSDLVWPVRVDPRGVTGPTRGQARTGAWRRTSQGLYVPAAVEQTVRQRIVEASAVLPTYGAVGGWASLRWLGGSWFTGEHHGRTLEVTLSLMDRS